MNIKQKITTLIIFVATIFGGVAFAPTAFAATCGGAETAILSCPQTSQGPDA